MKLLGGICAALLAYTVVLALGLASASGGSEVQTGAFPVGANLGLNPEQVRNATISLTVADDLNAPPLAVLSMMVSALGESDLLVVPNRAGSRYCGVYQANPSYIPCDDTEQQATRFLRGGLGFNEGGAIVLATAHPDWTPGHVAFLVEGDISNFGGDQARAAAFYDVHRGKAERIIAAWRSGGSVTSIGATDVAPDAVMTPKEVIDRIVLPIARTNGIQVTPASVEAANSAHSVLTTSGNVSDHKGPPDRAWAADMSDNWDAVNGSPNMTRLAKALSITFDIPWTGAGLVIKDNVRIGACVFRLQLIYLTLEGGNHFNHVHLGTRALGCH